MIAFHGGLEAAFKELNTVARKPYSFLLAYNELINQRDELVMAAWNKFLIFHKAYRAKFGDEGKIFLDSGAFSSWRQGFSITLSSYCRFLKKYGEYFDVIVALDEIAAADADAEAIAKSAATTWDNFTIMKNEGIDKIIPVFHSRETGDVFDRLCANSDYVGVGGIAYRVKDNATAIATCQKLFYDVQGVKKYPEHKFHAFGVGNFDACRAYDWYSIDSTVVQKITAFGRVLFIREGRGHFTIQKVHVSERQSTSTGAVYGKMDEATKAEFEASLKQYGDFTPGDFDEREAGKWARYNRAAYNMMVYDSFVNRLQALPVGERIAE